MTIHNEVAPQLKNPPTIPGLPLFGSAREFMMSDGLPIEYIQQSVTKYGDLVRFKVMNQSIYLLANPDLIHEVLVKRVKDFQKPEAIAAKNIGLGRFLGKGILTAGHEEWKPQRKLIQPLMHTKHITQYASTMAKLGDQLLSQWQDGSERDIHADMTQVTMWIIGETIFGIKNVDEQAPEIQATGTKAQEIAVADLTTPLPKWLTGGRDHEAARINEQFTALVKRFMEEHTNSDTERYDLLSLFMDTHDEDSQPLSDEFIRDNILTLFVAGHETTANTLTWAFYYLAQNPKVAEILRHEVDTILGERLPTVDDLPQLPYTLMIIKETMRIQPTVAAFPRRIMVDTPLGEYQLREDSVVFISPYVLHHDPRWWSNPEQFDPDRFSAENEPNIPKYAYLPFGGGPRICIGNHFALMEAQILLALIASRYQLHLPAGARVEPIRQVTTFPKHGLPMRLERRN